MNGNLCGKRYSRVVASYSEDIEVDKVGGKNDFGGIEERRSAEV
jgi:hypothetical protein